MKTIIAVALFIFLPVALLGAACGPSGGSVKVSPSWIDVPVEGGKVLLPTSELDSGKLLHFKLATEVGQETFMAYELKGNTYVRASVCPPCRSIGFSLQGNELVCNTCGTRFNASNGEGVSGACKAYPKAGVNTENDGGNTTVSVVDLMAAYNNTEAPGWP